VSARALGLGLAVYFAVVAMACFAISSRYRLQVVPHGEVVASVWAHGKLTARALLDENQETNAELEHARAAGGTLAREKVVSASPVFRGLRELFAISFVAGEDGLRARLDDKSAYVTPDDLLSRQAYDHGPTVNVLALNLGIDLNVVATLLGERLAADPSDVLARADIERVRMVPWPKATSTPTAASLSRDDVARSITAAGGYLARAVEEDGRLRYLVDATTGESQPGYNWPRHAGATYFLAQATAFTHDPAILAATLRAANYMRGSGLVTCGKFLCIGDASTVDLGASALAAVAFAEIVRTDLDRSYTPVLASLADFMRGQQRADGEFMHKYQRDEMRPIDTQGLYYSSEAVLALARTYRVLHNTADRDAASRGLAYLVGPGWSFFGSRYYFGEEHWTCQAVGELWSVAPDPKALDFCVRWVAFNRRQQQHEGDGPYDADGAHGIGPLLTPRLTPVASRCEAGVATLEAARTAGVEQTELNAIEQQMRHSLAFLLRHQFVPGRTHLFADPSLVHGAFPGSPVDWKLRIDYTQHAGSALIRWLEVTENQTR
jgi:hypothetical protein